MPTITLIRHGQASFGAENYDQLSNLGYQQAKHLGQYFAQTGRTVDHVVIGGMLRHKQSYESFYEIFSPQAILNANVVSEYNEFAHEQVLLVGNNFSSKAEMGQVLAQSSNPKAKLYELFNVGVARWQSGEHDQDYVESWVAFKQRCWQAFLNTVEAVNHLPQDAHCIVFSSGGVISAIAGELLGLSDRKIFELNFSMANAAMTQVKVKKARYQLVSLNEYSYLHHPERTLITWH